MTIKLSLDVMGGDKAPLIVLEGAENVLSFSEDINFLLFGDQDIITDKLKHFPLLSKKSEIIHCSEVVTNDTKPVAAIRGLKDSSMRKAIESVSKGQANAVVSAGNTGAYMALAKIMLKTLEGIDRPAIAAPLPTINGICIGLDMGANLECTTENLVQFAVMGEVMARRVLGIKNPRVSLLNVGTEEVKGHAVVQQASLILKEIPTMNYIGFIEGDDVNHGVADVIVTDGFTGNIALKTLEGAAHFIFDTIRETLSSTILGKLSYLVGRPAFNSIKSKLDPRKYNGAAFLGLRGIAIKSHGGADAAAFANAIKVAFNLSKDSETLDLGQEIETKIKEI
ncbi:phosphate acyltransferase PlsX [Candidatus Odyssella thessalonicensis]|uniref:phosphate acyltransferase PlsX n=1 Tax=Candidatus Odyssella thessalonicensis TaxID=84647 RepID=UPI000225B441|nr:phosphate acyltransferase PlsX [Candidatus Odyssella thessalonicensis]